MPFKKGQSGNPNGRKKGSKNRNAIAINAIFRVMEKYGEQFEKELDKLCKKNPLGFYFKFVKDVQPRDLKIEHDIMPENVTIQINANRPKSK